MNPAGVSIGRAYLKPGNNYPCVILNEKGERIGFLQFSKWLGEGEAVSWSFYIDRRSQGKGYGTAALEVAIALLRRAWPKLPIKLAAEAANASAHRLYTAHGFRHDGELDGDDLVFTLDAADGMNLEGVES